MESKQNPLASTSDHHKQGAHTSKAPILREGNKAYDVDRPFFE
jgi:hypothetical protein